MSIDSTGGAACGISNGKKAYARAGASVASAPGSAALSPLPAIDLPASGPRASGRGRALRDTLLRVDAEEGEYRAVAVKARRSAPKQASDVIVRPLRSARRVIGAGGLFTLSVR